MSLKYLRDILKVIEWLESLWNLVTQNFVETDNIYCLKKRGGGWGFRKIWIMGLNTGAEESRERLQSNSPNSQRL